MVLDTCRVSKGSDFDFKQIWRRKETLTSLHLQSSEKWSLVRDRFVPGWFFTGNFLAKRSFWLEASFASKFVMIGGAWARNTRFLSRRSLLFRYIVRTSSWPRGHKSWRNHDGFQFITAHKLPTDVLAMHTVADCLLGCHFPDYWMMANGPYEKCGMDTHSTHTHPNRSTKWEDIKFVTINMYFGMCHI